MGGNAGLIVSCFVGVDGGCWLASSPVSPPNLNFSFSSTSCHERGKLCLEVVDLRVEATEVLLHAVCDGFWQKSLSQTKEFAWDVVVVAKCSRWRFVLLLLPCRKF